MRLTCLPNVAQMTEMKSVVLMFDDDSYTAIASAVAILSAKSAFEPPTQQFHVKIIDALMPRRTTLWRP